MFPSFYERKNLNFSAQVTFQKSWRGGKRRNKNRVSEALLADDTVKKEQLLNGVRGGSGSDGEFRLQAPIASERRSCAEVGWFFIVVYTHFVPKKEKKKIRNKVLYSKLAEAFLY